MDIIRIKQHNSVSSSCGVLFVLLLSGVFIVSSDNSYGQNLTLSITEPRDNDRVCWKHMVRGNVSNLSLQVFVLIHPMATNKFWVEPIPNMSGNDWAAYCYFGEPKIGIGEPFEIIAVASQNRELFREGDTLPSPLPNNSQIQVRSKPVIVIRDPCLYR